MCPCQLRCPCLQQAAASVVCVVYGQKLRCLVIWTDAVRLWLPQGAVYVRSEVWARGLRR